MFRNTTLLQAVLDPYSLFVIISSFHLLSWIGRRKMFSDIGFKIDLLLSPRDLLRSIVISTSVCVCLSIREDISGTTRAIFTNFCGCCLSPWLGPPPVRLRSPKRKGNVWDFLPHWQCSVQHSIWDPCKTAEPIEIPFGVMIGRLGQSVTWG